MTESGKWAAPGRLNIIGEHTDYNDGYALPIALPQVVTCEATIRSDDVVRVESRQYPGDIISVRLSDLSTNPIPGWSRYPLGVVHELQLATGLDLRIDSDVPVGAGLSSSAAVTCAVAIAVRDLAFPDLTDDDLIAVTSAAENDYVGAPTGTLDQSASLLCAAGHALFIDFGSATRAQVPFDLAASGLAVLVVDTNTPHALADGEYAARRAQCHSAAKTLGVDSLRDAWSVEQLDDDLLRRRARHVVTENARVLDVVDTLRSGRDVRMIGPALTASHASLRDDFEVTTPQLDLAVDIALATGAYGARMVGGGFGGSVIALVDTSSADAVAGAITRDFALAGFQTPRTFVATPSAGARRLR